MIYANIERELIEKWWSLISLSGVGAKLPFRLWKESQGRLNPHIHDFQGRALKTIKEYLERDHGKQFRTLEEKLGNDVDLLVIGSEKYPESLLKLETPPIFLFVQGDISILERFGSAVVGTRNPDREAIRLTDMVVRRKIVRGHTIISGGAIGIDTAAHQCALKRSGKTVVVAPSGIRALTPISNRPLFTEIIKNRGCIVSEYPPFSKPRKFHFHRRNSILAALSNEVIVIRAAKKSGTLITARSAVELGKPLFSIPGSPLDPIAEGSNQLLKDGDAEYFDFNNPPGKSELKAKAPLADAELSIYKLLNSPKTIDEIYEGMKTMRPSEVLVLLTMMEMSGHIEKDGRIGAYRRA